MSEKLKLLTCAIAKEIVEEILVDPKLWNIENIETAEQFEDGLDKYCSEPYDLVLCGDNFSADFMNEFAQVMRQQGNHLPLFSINTAKENFQPVLFKKNGFSDSYFWPIDKQIMVDRINDLAANSNSQARNYKPIFVMDLDAKSKVPFETYVHLPMNNKHIRFSAKNEPMGEKKWLV